MVKGSSSVPLVNGLPMKTGAWDADEDEKLASYQKLYGNKWSVVAQFIPGRTGQQCAQRWRHKVNPNIKKDKWTPEEDALLTQLVAEHGNRWAEIARHMDGRTDQQCMGRWTRHLDPNISRETWRPEEDALLISLHDQHGTHWSRISKSLQGRTAQQCRARFFQIRGPGAAGEVDGEGKGRGEGGGGGGRGRVGKRRSRAGDDGELESDPEFEHLGSYRPRSSRRAVVPRRSIGDAAPSRPAPEALPPAPEPVPEPAVPEAAVSGPGRGSVGGRKGREEGEGARGREGRGGKEKGEGGRRGLVAEVAGAPLQPLHPNHPIPTPGLPVKPQPHRPSRTTAPPHPHPHRAPPAGTHTAGGGSNPGGGPNGTSNSNMNSSLNGPHPGGAMRGGWAPRPLVRSASGVSAGEGAGLIEALLTSPAKAAALPLFAPSTSTADNTPTKLLSTHSLSPFPGRDNAAAPTAPGALPPLLFGLTPARRHPNARHPPSAAPTWRGLLSPGANASAFASPATADRRLAVDLACPSSAPDLRPPMLPNATPICGALGDAPALGEATPDLFYPRSEPRRLRDWGGAAAATTPNAGGGVGGNTGVHAAGVGVGTVAEGPGVASSPVLGSGRSAGTEDTVAVGRARGAGRERGSVGTGVTPGVGKRRSAAAPKAPHPEPFSPFATAGSGRATQPHEASPFADQLPTMPRSAAPATPKARLINALERC